MLWKEKLATMLNDYKKWAKKSLHNKTMRELYLAIIKILEKEIEDARGKTNFTNRGVMGYHFREHSKEDGQARDFPDNPSSALAPSIRPKKERVYCLGRKAK